MKGERKGIRKFNISYGAGGGIWTHKGLAQRIFLLLYVTIADYKNRCSLEHVFTLSSFMT